ncbi:hypothetical protein NKR23_g12187 [Pleurostoma richardsiae]|uniref:Uncharacterized protein n=1 Tax=Pleurostoma richardsiae TaxID=41990 RepID=A0AA38R297_9PEZI|nr:hypothetical protein NKR23_g12187 [Pleurostoma richardsiae]
MAVCYKGTSEELPYWQFGTKIPNGVGLTPEGVHEAQYRLTSTAAWNFLPGPPLPLPLPFLVLSISKWRTSVVRTHSRGPWFAAQAQPFVFARLALEAEVVSSSLGHRACFLLQ